MDYFKILVKYNPKNVLNERTYNTYYGFFEESQWWTREELQAYQWKKLINLLEHSYNNVPYYTNLFKELDAHPDDIKSLNDFKKLPFLTKNIIRERIDDFFPKNYSKKKAIYYTTGGSTGEPLGFYKMRENDIIERAFMYQQWKRVGFTQKSTKVIIRGEPVKHGKLFSKNKFSNDWLFSSYLLSKEYIKNYVDKLNEIKPDFFHVYPASFYIFTQLLLECSLKLNFTPKAILCGSENLHDYQRELFEKTFNTRAYCWLGLAEQTTLAGECEHSNYLHAWPQHSLVELYDEFGNEVNKIGSIGEIVGTNLHNYVTPFIRYKSGDLASFGGNQCEKCGRNFSILREINGRIQYKILLEGGRNIPLTALTFGLHFEAYKRIKAMQIIQRRIGEIWIFINPLPSFSSKDEDEIKQKMLKAVGDNLIIRFKQTNKLQKSKSGKHIYFIQELGSN